MVSYVFDVKDGELASDLSLAVMRLARQLRFRRPESPVTLSQLSALAMLAKEGAMTPGALAVRERVRPPSMTRVAASPAGAALVDRERRASQDWLRKRLATLGPEDRDILLQAADLMTVLVDEDA